MISIHALVKRATPTKYVGGRCPLISIHALVKRATIVNRIRDILNKHFNPRPRKEGDAIFKKGKLNFGISIHALVKRATH